jgi:hypothetical protein
MNLKSMRRKETTNPTRAKGGWGVKMTSESLVAQRNKVGLLKQEGKCH